MSKSALDWFISQLEMKIGKGIVIINEEEIRHAKKMEQEQQEEIREAVADYMRSEGCSCCRDDNHGENAERLALLLDAKYENGANGFDWSKYCKKPKHG